MMFYVTSTLSLLLVTLEWSEAYVLNRRDDRNCNNSPRICDQPYDTVTYLGAHNSPFLRDPSTLFTSSGNQYFNTTVQLSAGVRLLSAQIHVASNPKTSQRELHVCHSSCGIFDAGSLVRWLLEVRTWMDANPHDVVTLVLINKHKVDARELEGVYSQADIAHYAYVPPQVDRPPPPSNENIQTWPTLNDMIDRDTRLVSFIQPLKVERENAPYLLDQFTFVWENPYDVTDPTNFTCQPDRPSEPNEISAMQKTGRLFLMNHMLYWQQLFGIKVPDSRNIQKTNAWGGEGGLGSHMLECVQLARRQPTFVLVDFFNVGPAIKVVDIFNEVSKPMGRLAVTEEVMEGAAAFRAAGRPLKVSRVFWRVAAMALISLWFY